MYRGIVYECIGEDEKTFDRSDYVFTQNIFWSKAKLWTVEVHNEYKIVQGLLEKEVHVNDQI